MAVVSSSPSLSLSRSLLPPPPLHKSQTQVAFIKPLDLRTLPLLTNLSLRFYSTFQKVIHSKDYIIILYIYNIIRVVVLIKVAGWTEARNCVVPDADAPTDLTTHTLQVLTCNKECLIRRASKASNILFLRDEEKKFRLCVTLIATKNKIFRIGFPEKI